MKPTRFLIVAIVLLGMVATASALTPAGTEITNKAYGNYKDANGNDMDQVESNEVMTTVAQVGGVSISPESQGVTIEPQTDATYSVEITNTGNGSDSFDLTTSISGTYSGTYTFEIYSDLDSNGVIDGSDALLHTIPTTGTGSYTTPSRTYGGIFHFVIKVENTDAAPDGDAPVVNIAVESNYDATKTTSGTYTTTVNSASLTVEMETNNTTPEPGDQITYTICVTNGAGAGTAHNVVFTNVIPANTTYLDESILLGTTSISDADDIDEGDYGQTAASTVTVNLGNIAAGEEVCVSFTVTVNDDVPVGTVIDNDPSVDYENEEGDGQTPVTPPDGSGNGDETIAQQYLVSITTTDPVAYDADPSDSLFVDVTVTNDGNGTDDFVLSFDSDEVTWTFYYDADGDGYAEPGEEVTTTGDLLQNGSINLIAVGVVNDDAADQVEDDNTLTATSDDDPATTPASGDLSITVTITAPFLKLTKTVTHDASGSAVEYGENDANSAPPGTTLTYTIVVQNWGTGEATTIVITDAIPTNTTYVDNSADASGGTESGGTVTWNIATLAGDDDVNDQSWPGEATLTFQVTVD